MERSWTITVLGVRGSAPAAGQDFLEYGGSTSCFAVDCGDTLAVLDAGTGLAGLEERLSRPDAPKRVDILLGHLHLDHVLGLFSFSPLSRPDREVHLYGRPGLAGALNRLMGPPFWPVALEEFPAQISIHEIPPDSSFLLAGGLTVTVLEGRHPDGCLYYRLERDGRRLVYALDCEPDAAMLDRLADFAQDAGLLIWDANFTPADIRPGWGHSTWEAGAALGRRAKVNTVLMAHYNRDYTDIFLREQERLAAQTGGWVRFAREGMVITL